MEQDLILFVSFISIATILSPSAAAALASPRARPALNLWPMPTAVSWPNPTAVPLSPSFSILCPFRSQSPLRYAVARYSRLLFSERHAPLLPLDLPRPSSSSPPLRSLVISVADPFAPLGPGADESYNLSVPLHSSDAILFAASPWGAMRGLETFSQLSWGASPTLIVAGISIADSPLYTHRGIVLDTSRNFYPVRDIFRTLRAMSYNKLNVLHWHLTDSQSFPLLLPSVPELALRGSYGPAMRYTPDDVRRVVRYAMRRGIRVVPEIDSPGHTGSWGEAYPDIVTCAGKFWLPPNGASLAAEPGTGQLNPLEHRTYEVVRGVLRDVADLFIDPFLHAGADEVATACWDEDQKIQSFLAAGGTHDQLLETYVNLTRPFIVSSLNRTVVYWEDVILGTKVKVEKSILPPETTVLQTWNNGPNNTKLLTAAGYRVIVSSSDFYYLDCGQGGWVGNDSRYDRQVGDDPDNPFNYAGGNGGSWCAPFKSWQRVYDYDITYGLSAEEARLVLGGEVALWSEQADATVVDGLLWPRASAMAEALWSGNRDGKGRKRYAEATDRLNEWRHRMVERGIAATPIQPLWCVMHPGMCNLVQ